MSEWIYYCVSFGVGVLSGFQGISERFPTDAAKATRTIWGLLYLVSRGGIAVGAFALGAHIPYLDQHSFWRAIACGVGAEGILRTQFYLKRSKKEGRDPEDIAWGPLNLLRFYQDQFLIAIRNRLSKPGMWLVEEIADRFHSFPEMYDFFDNRIPAWQTDPRVSTLAKAAASLNKSYQDAQTVEASNAADRKYRLKLGYLAKDVLGMTKLQNIFEQNRPA